MLKRNKEPKKEPSQITDEFFSDPITEKLLDVVATISNENLVSYWKERIKPVFALAKTLALKSSLGLWSDEQGFALFTTPKAKQLLERLRNTFQEKED